MKLRWRRGMGEPLASQLLDGEFGSCGARDFSSDTDTYLFSHFRGSLFDFVSQPRHRRSKPEDLRSCPLDTPIQYKKSEGPFDVEPRPPSLAVVLRQFFRRSLASQIAQTQGVCHFGRTEGA